MIMILRAAPVDDRPRVDPSGHGLRSWLVRIAVASVLIAGALIGGIKVHEHVTKRTNTTSQATIARATARYFAQAASAEKAGKLNDARLAYLEVLKLDPLNVFAYYDLGDLYQTAGQSNDAAAAYEKALLIKPNYTPALFNLAVLETPTAPPSAIALYKRIEAIEPKYAAAYFNLGLLELQINMTADGTAQLTKAVQLDPSLYARIPPSVLPPSIKAAHDAQVSATR
jgi:tetratricopeptide (TPR) repeat protein